MGYDNWRLPSANECFIGNCPESELGNLFYIEGITVESQDPFTNIQQWNYWTGTENPSNLNEAVIFHFYWGLNDITGKGYDNSYAWCK